MLLERDGGAEGGVGDLKKKNTVQKMGCDSDTGWVPWEGDGGGDIW